MSDQNISLFGARLRRETDPAQRALLCQLMIAEEDRYGSRVERLEKADQLIGEAEARILSQERLSVARRRAGQHNPLYDALIKGEREALEAFRAYRRTLVEALDRGSP